MAPFLAPQSGDLTAPAVIDAASGRALSHAQLHDEAERLATRLASVRGGLAFLLTRNASAVAAAYLACVEAGVAVVLLDGRTQAEALHDLLERYRPELVLSMDTGALAPGWRAWEQDASGLLLAWREGTHDGEPVHPELAVLLSTSGSTGSPKLVRLTRRNLEANAASIRASLGIGPEERALASLPIHYSYGLSVLNSHLSAGGSAVLTDESVVTPGYWAALRRHGCTSTAGVPYTYQMLARLRFEQLEVPSLRTMTQAGGKLADELVTRFHADMVRRGGRFFVMYGQTEATARIACLPSERLPEKLGSAGRAIPGGLLTIDESPGPEPRGGSLGGEIVYAGPNVMMGYATRRVELARGDELRGVLRTGDLGRLDGDGFLYVTGRSKRIGKVFGLRVNLDEVEARLRPHGPTAVVAGDDRLLVFCEYGTPERFNELARALAADLRVHHSAFVFRRLDALPLNANGKIDYQRLADA